MSIFFCFCQTVFRQREQLMSRANSLKKAIRQIIEHTEKGISILSVRRSISLSFSAVTIQVMWWLYCELHEDFRNRRLCIVMPVRAPVGNFMVFLTVFLIVYTRH